LAAKRLLDEELLDGGGGMAHGLLLWFGAKLGRGIRGCKMYFVGRLPMFDGRADIEKCMIVWWPWVWRTTH
jgi:hypothetical protein